MLKNLKKFASFQKLTLPDLKFDLHELEPVLSQEAMDLHYNKHHVAYINNYNKFAEQYLNAEAKGNMSELLKLSKLIAFNGGGHYNHTFFWENLSPQNKNGGVVPAKDSKFGQAISKSFGSVEKLISKFNAKSIGIQGSGWGWLACDIETNQLILAETSN